MVGIAHRARTSLAIASAGAAIVTAGLLAPASPERPLASESSPYITARLATSSILEGAADQDVAVTIRMPGRGEAARPPLSLAVVIDRSGSMNGPPLANARRAADELVEQLRPDDAFAIVTYSSSDETVVPMHRATGAAKAAAHAAIATITDDGGTCISCGLARGTRELAHSPVAGGLRRMVLISDGQANEGVWDRDELAQLAGDISAFGAAPNAESMTRGAHGVSISTVGVGLDFDELTMIRLAQVGHGNYYFVEDTANLGAMFAAELGGIADTVATDVRLVVHPASAAITGAYGYTFTREPVSGDVIVPIADLRAGETRKVVLHARVEAGGTGARSVGRFELAWRSPTSNTPDHATATLVTTITRDPSKVAVDPDALRAIEEARAARVLEDAAITYEKQGSEAAQRVLQRHVDELRAAGTLTPRIEGAAHQAMDSFAAEPAEKAKKVTRTSAFELAR